MNAHPQPPIQTMQAAIETLDQAAAQAPLNRQSHIHCQLAANALREHFRQTAATVQTPNPHENQTP